MLFSVHDQQRLAQHRSFRDQGAIFSGLDVWRVATPNLYALGQRVVKGSSNGIAPIRRT